MKIQAFLVGGAEIVNISQFFFGMGYNYQFASAAELRKATLVLYDSTDESIGDTIVRAFVFPRVPVAVLNFQGFGMLFITNIQTAL
jgi:hypothetical protein